MYKWVYAFVGWSGVGCIFSLRRHVGDIDLLFGKLRIILFSEQYHWRNHYIIMVLTFLFNFVDQVVNEIIVTLHLQIIKSDIRHWIYFKINQATLLMFITEGMFTRRFLGANIKIPVDFSGFQLISMDFSGFLLDFSGFLLDLGRFL